MNVYLARLHPSDDVNWRQDPAAMRAYLERLWDFVKTLDPRFNSLKAHVLYHRLVFDRSQGKYDLERFLEYLKLPKNVVYILPQFMEPIERQQSAANLQQDYSGVTMLPVVGDDEPLVRSYLEHFLRRCHRLQGIRAVHQRPVSESSSLPKRRSSTAWATPSSCIPCCRPEKYQQLKERIDLDFAYTNKTELGGRDPVGLDLYVKNVDTLIVKVFEINTQNFYREHLAEIGTDINLDGLVANEEKTYTYKEPPLRRVRRHFEFPALAQRGVYVIDFIGNGKASRALIRKGKLQFLVRTSVAGSDVHGARRAEQAGSPRPCSGWPARCIRRSEDGTIAVPFSNAPGRQPLVMSLGEFSSLAYFEQESENYQLDAAMYVDREELIARRKAQLIVRPQLSLDGTPVSRKSLEDVRLVITSTDLDNVDEHARKCPISSCSPTARRSTNSRCRSGWRTIRFHAQGQGPEPEPQPESRSGGRAGRFRSTKSTRPTRPRTCILPGSAANYVVDLLGKTGEAEAGSAGAVRR